MQTNELSGYVVAELNIKLRFHLALKAQASCLYANLCSGGEKL